MMDFTAGTTGELSSSAVTDAQIHLIRSSEVAGTMSCGKVCVF